MRDLDLIGEFEKRYNKDIAPIYEDRDTRNLWAASVLNGMPGATILNLGGGGERHLEKYLDSRWRVHELDITGDCDTKLNLDGIDRLPFADNSFDICCAFDVLEHLENFHLIADEIYRVSKSTLLISLPNSALEIPSIFRNVRAYDDPLENGVYSKYYGIPLAPPKDRHRWWMTFEDIVRFFLCFENEKGCTTEFFVPDKGSSLKRSLFTFIAGERLYMTLFCSTVWIRIEKRA
jgi:hypothetical protein